MPPHYLPYVPDTHPDTNGHRKTQGELTRLRTKRDLPSRAPHLRRRQISASWARRARGSRDRRCQRRCLADHPSHGRARQLRSWRGQMALRVALSRKNGGRWPRLTTNPAGRFVQRGSAFGAVRMRLGRCQALPGFGHPAARPAAGGLAEHPRELALGHRPARLEAGAVGGHCGGVDVAVRASGSHRPWCRRAGPPSGPRGPPRTVPVRLPEPRSRSRAREAGRPRRRA